MGIKQAHTALTEHYKSPGQQRSGSLSITVSCDPHGRNISSSPRPFHSLLLSAKGTLSSHHQDSPPPCRAAHTLPLKHTALLWQRTAGSDSVLLSAEITQTTPKISIPFTSISQPMKLSARNYPYCNAACFMQLQVTQDH